MFNFIILLYHGGDLGNLIFVYLIAAIIAVVVLIGVVIFLLIKLGQSLSRRNERNYK